MWENKWNDCLLLYRRRQRNLYSVQNLNVDLLFRAQLARTVSRIVQIMTNRRDQIKIYQSGSIFESISSRWKIKKTKGNAHFQFGVNLLRHFLFYILNSGLTFMSSINFNFFPFFFSFFFISGNLGSEHVAGTQHQCRNRANMRKKQQHAVLLC